MKNVKKIILLIILFMPFIIKAETYSEAVDIADNYMLNSTYRNTYARYLFEKSTHYYDDSNPYRGGLLSYKEFVITQKGKGEGYSYLYDGIKYWTYTKDGNNRLIVSDKKESKSENDNSIKTKVTEFIREDAKVIGVGTWTNPWVFVPTYEITIETSEHGKIAESNNGTCNGISLKDSVTLSYKNDEIKLCLKPDDGYVYVDNDCNTFMTFDNNMIRINKITKDLKCKIQFGRETNEIELDQTGVDVKSVPEKIYTIYSDGWYRDKGASSKLIVLDKIPAKNGYTFKGYYTGNNASGTKVIDEDGKVLITDTTGPLFMGSAKLYAEWEANDYKVTLNKQNGTGGTDSIVATINSTMPTITVPTRSGFAFNGYYTGTNGSGTKYYNANGSSARNWDLKADTTLYAYWKDNTPPTCTLTGASTTWTTSNRTITYGCSDTGSGCKAGRSGGSITYTTTTTTATIPAYTIEDNAGNVTNCPAKTVNVYKATSITNKLYNCSRYVPASGCSTKSTPGCANEARCNYCPGFWMNWIYCCSAWWQWAESGQCWATVCSTPEHTDYLYNQTSCPSGYSASGSAFCPSGYANLDSTRCYR